MKGKHHLHKERVEYIPRKIVYSFYCPIACQVDPVKLREGLIKMLANYLTYGISGEYNFIDRRLIPLENINIENHLMIHLNSHLFAYYLRFT